MYHQVTDVLGHPALTALIAAAPLLVLLVLLGGLRMKSHWAALIGLATALLIAATAYHMPLGQAADSALEGAAFGLFPIVWIVLNAVWINKLQRVGGHFDIIGRAFTSLSDDRRIQAILIAYCFGAMLESLSGFGTPIAITSLILLTLGLKPIKAAVVATFANTAPAAFGSVGNPIQALAKATSFSEHDLGMMVGRQSAVIAALIPLVLLLILDGRRGLRELWPIALITGAGFGAGQYLCSNFFTYQLTDLAGAVVSTVVLVVTLRFWSPNSRPAQPRSVLLDTATGRAAPLAEAAPLTGSAPLATAGATAAPASGSGTGLPAPAPDRDGHREGPPTGAGGDSAPESGGAATPPKDSLSDTLKAFAPYVLLVVLFSLTSIQGPVERFVEARGTSFSWPGLHAVTAHGEPVAVTSFDFGWLGAAGTMLLLTGLLTALILRTSPRRALRCYGQALSQIRWAVITIACVLALSYVMNVSGMAVSLGTWLAGLGGAFALLSGFLGWFGVALTGSDTSSNALFGAMQVTAADHIGLSPLLMAASNSTGGVQGKAAAMQNLAIAASAVGLSGKEGDIFRKVVGWSLGVLVVFCVLAWLQTTSILSWMVVGN
ncbi:L-lactate permease [Streptomyces sp. 8L]|uniref:L-lactate permease n=1 Tax=Streptomyces sp. 8L TaxID=2877242 RepID=UPI001CD6317F|nr:L-lactate permease [Streptomyces sp. 8L]MCA1217140.1 L-lactate permease [Streptomyces sp. 8L]